MTKAEIGLGVIGCGLPADSPNQPLSPLVHQEVRVACALLLAAP